MTTTTPTPTPTDLSTSKPLSGRVAAITGASSGIGAATARSLAAAGADVALLARRRDRLEQLAEEIGGGAVAVELDVTSADDAKVAAAAVREQLGPVDLLFNNAGVMLPAPIEELAEEQWHHQIDLNVGGVMNVIGAFLPQLVEAAAAGGSVDLVNTSSIAAQNIFPNFAVYSASKSFVTHLSRHLRAELGPKGVRVAALEPGITTTELQSHVTDDGAREWLAGAAKSMELLRPEDVATVVTFLAALPPHVNLQQVTVMPTAEEM